MGEVLNSNIDKEMKKKVKIPKNFKKKIEDFAPEGVPLKGKEGEYDDVRLIIYSQVKKTGIKKKPDMTEIGLSGDLSEKIEFVKANMAKEISIKDVFSDGIGFKTVWPEFHTRYNPKPFLIVRKKVPFSIIHFRSPFIKLTFVSSSRY